MGFEHAMVKGEVDFVYFAWTYRSFFSSPEHAGELCIISKKRKGVWRNPYNTDPVLDWKNPTST